MSHVENLTPFAALAIPSMLVSGADALIVLIAGRFLLPPPGKSTLDPPTVAEEQPDPPLADTHRGPPETSSLLTAGQATCGRPGTDVWIEGHAVAPGEKPAERVDVALVIPDRLQKTVAVFGDRVWTQGIGTLTPQSPRPFVRMPLVYERAFGGAEPGDAPVRPFEPRNPVGRGFFEKESQALGQPLPNLEDPRDLLRTPRDRPRPMAFGPIARSWQPRLGYAGTYDQKWLDDIAPAWPKDLDPRFFHNVPPDQVVTPHLRGGEAIGISGVHPAGQIHFALPSHRLSVKTVLHAQVTWQSPELDAVIIEPDAGAFTVIWRAVTPLPKGPLDHEYSVVRTLFDWEAPPR
ncbi:MAG: DUF2169 domain-containing protein [Polyangiaceae bacterium]